MTLGLGGVTPEYAFLAVDDSLVGSTGSAGIQMKLWHAGHLGWACCAGSPLAGLSVLSALFLLQSPRVGARLARDRRMQRELEEVIRKIWKGSDGGLAEAQNDPKADPHRRTRFVLVGDHPDDFYWWLKVELDDTSGDHLVQLEARWVDSALTTCFPVVGILDDDEETELASEIKSLVKGPAQGAVEGAIRLIQEKAADEERNGTHRVSASGHLVLHQAGKQWEFWRFTRGEDPRRLPGLL